MAGKKAGRRRSQSTARTNIKMDRGQVTPAGDWIRIVRVKQSPYEKRVLAYIKKVISNSKLGYCCVSQETIRKAMGVRKQVVTDALASLVASGKLVRFAGENGKRRNEKHYYFLPDAEPLGNPNKSLFFSGVLQGDVGSRKLDFSGVENWRNLERLELIEAYFQAGFLLTPLIEAGKIPLAGWTKEYIRTRTKNQVMEYFATNQKLNVGCWVPDGLIAVDVDDAERFYELTGGEVFDTLTSSSGRGFHNWFLNGLQIGNANAVRPSLDFKGAGTLVVLPPSIHKSGRQYEWTNLRQPMEAPHLIKDLYDTRESVRNYGERKEGVRRSLPFITKQTVIEEGARYNQLFRLGRHLRTQMQVDELEVELHRYNEACCRPPLDHKRMQRLIRDVRFGADRKDLKSKHDHEAC